ncbi:2-keto-4-pentenoate hydratase/2-oxohepta-3-ene-1,7-dioic acid hydratase (catechol pathway) [Mameliella alba]|uniref:fumarylacetoacetate hydrolase family protein n=1 Tax=Mameliella alba TaxID=561184 RepID=UPI000880BBBF|nr:fumarylacetoacetate hydrolase family protein [Mameliella alba]OWV46818.1 2-hydroxyhepta-2,4-diene-1,7-dioate isomerase [Mameliella alba]PTR37738.1 2-keto-4-pentenoate hydratase/2-oxohepta-3-ene-1,7-dioic acid hydratase in catechol pathway [Mameliella alba]GGF50605.1 2-keto-4-pentenoate hydratase [Mameliella alba]SDD62090.1 2-keto-4-pentenoate hydratase/2-oxohepta-3-ene-1,7-dioic acid hydratase (catechol pathway) [Mameliella alba]
MKFARYGERGAEKPALVEEDGTLRDLSAHVDDIAGDALTRLDTLKAIDPASLPKVEGTPRLGACVGRTGKFICIGLNYADHAAESGLEVPPEPVIFAKYTSAICGPNDPIIIPRGSEKTDWEVELGFVIGKKAKYVDEANAMDHVAGFCVINDVSERAYQIERSGQWSKGKSSDNFGPTGPWLVTPDEVGDFDKLHMWLDVNGERMQDGSTATMVYRVPFLISYLSQFFTLEPGDIISTGTPPGVGLGFTPPKYLKAGDEVRLGIEKLGEQRQVCVADD